MTSYYPEPKDLDCTTQICPYLRTGENGRQQTGIDGIVKNMALWAGLMVKYL